MIRTSLGDIDAADLGPTDYHEHLFQVSPLLPDDDLDNEERSGEEATLLHAAGIDAMVDATPIALGRDPESVARISRRTGLTVILTTGAHRLAHYGTGHWLADLDVEALAARFRNDLVDGIPKRDRPDGSPVAVDETGAPIRAGMLKAGLDYWRIGPFEQKVLEGLAAAHGATGAPVMVHLEFGSAAVEVLERLEGLHVPADRVVLAHIDRNPDPGLHRELASAGAYLGYDGMARHRSGPDSTVLDVIERVAETASERIVIGGDVARRTRYVAYGGMPGLAYLPERFLPRLASRVGGDLVARFMVENPRRLLSWSTPSVV
jgi:predicted metal-dependent phosphotriesterase family hydrolase